MCTQQNYLTAVMYSVYILIFMLVEYKTFYVYKWCIYSNNTKYFLVFFEEEMVRKYFVYTINV